jgi:hypothetical protein
LDGNVISAVEARQAQLSEAERVIDVVFTFASKDTGAFQSRKAARVDVTHEFPYQLPPDDPEREAAFRLDEYLGR